jgi:hypothetical protein
MAQSSATSPNEDGQEILQPLELLIRVTPRMQLSTLPLDEALPS